MKTSKLLKSSWQWLRTFWCDPKAPELASEYRARQIHSLAQQLPLASLATIFVVIIGLISATDKIEHNLLAIWTVLLLSIAMGDLVAWYLLVNNKIKSVGSFKTIIVLSSMLGLAGLLYACMAVLLFGVLDFPGLIVLVALIAAFISTGAWQFAVLPAAGVLWVLSLCISISIGLLINFGSQYAFISSLVVVYCIYLTCAVLVTSRRFVSSLMAETSIKQQSQIVGLLLRDFENNASDWLWEIDASGSLKHVSARMESILGLNSGSLLGQKLINIFSQQLPENDSDATAALKDFKLKLQSIQPFSKVRTATQVLGEKKWWALTAQPLFDSSGVFEGWRGVGSDITEALQKEHSMIELANTDSLTGLANRHLFGKTLQDCFSKDELLAKKLTLIILDLDNFKLVNDMLGHLAGDELLKEVALRLQSITPSNALLARLGGDEFSWIIPNGLTPLQSEEFGKTVLKVLTKPWFHQEHSFNMSASIGVATAPSDGVSPIALQRASDMALYSAKSKGRNTLCFFDTKLDEVAMRRLALLNDLRQSLDRKEFVVLYQPQIRFSDSALVGFEALVRWHHPIRGIVSPIEFIPLTEENGLILPLGEWVLNKACSDAIKWPAPLRVAVNVSSVQIERSDLLATVQSCLSNTRMHANRLELELTESSLMKDGDKAIKLLNSLRRTGVRIALDDFGTGYSSLSYLQRFPIDKLKVDRSFVLAASAQVDDKQKSESARSILQAILHLAQALGLETIAEGVETEEMVDMLRKLGFEQAQGFFYGRPMTEKQAQLFIMNWPVVTT